MVQRKNIHAVYREDNYFPQEKFNVFNSLFNSVYLVFFNTLVFSIVSLFAVRYLWDVCNEDKCCVVTHHPAHARGAWLGYVRTYCVPTATLNQNKRSRLLYLGDAKLIIDSSKLCLPSPHEFPRYIIC